MISFISPVFRTNKQNKPVLNNYSKELPGLLRADLGMLAKTQRCDDAKVLLLKFAVISFLIAIYQ